MAHLAVTGTLAAAGVVIVAAMGGWLPVFFIPGVGGTALRQAVLWAAIAMFLVTAGLMGKEYRHSPTAFLFWYGLGLVLVAVGLFGVMMQSIPGDLVGWAGRGTQFLGGAYILLAAHAGIRESRVWGLPLELVLRDTQDRLKDQIERYELVLAGAGAALWDWDVPNRRVVFSAQWKTLHGYAEAEDIHQEAEWRNGIHPEDREGVLEALQRHFEGRTPVFAKEYRILCKDGRLKWVSDRGIAQRDAAGRVVRMAGSEIEITDRKRYEHELLQAVNTGAALNRIGEALHTTLDFEDILHRVVSEGSAVLGSGSAAVSLVKGGTRVVSREKTVSHEAITEMMRSQERHTALILESRQVVAVDDAFADKRLDGGQMRRHRTPSVLIAPLVIRNEAAGLLFFNYHSAPHRFTSVEIDFVQQMANMAGIALSNAKLVKDLEESNQELNEHGYALTHNLKAPLRAIQNYTNFLFEDFADGIKGEPRQFLEGIRTAAKQGHEQITDLETLHRIKNHEVHHEWVSVGELFDEMQALFPDRTERRLVVSPSVPTIWGEHYLLRQILIELIQNGFKFNRSEPKQVEIGCRRVPEGDALEVFVQDNGIGIAPHYHDQIFRIFQRLHTEAEYHGTGIGLAVVKRAAQKMGTVLRVASTVGAGSRFSFLLPSVGQEDNPPEPRSASPVLEHS